MTENEPLLEEFEVFKEAMLEDNLTLQIDIVKQLKSLAKALGEKLTREKLLPFIEENINFHDEILFNLSEQLQHFVPLVGGYEHAGVIFAIMTKLCATDEILVREGAIQTLKLFANDMNDKQLGELLYPTVEVLLKDEWFTSKCSAIMLFSTCYPKLSDDRKNELRNRFRTLIQDDSSLVRKAAALACSEFVNCLEIDCVKREFIPIFCDIAQDPSDVVRSFAIDIALSLSDKLTEDEIDGSIFKIIEQASDDTSWRTRYRLANNIAEIQSKIYFARHRGKIVAIFQKLSQDVQSEVRIVTAKNVFNFCQSLLDSYVKQPQFDNNFEPVFEQSIVPSIRKLSTDEVDEVRVTLSSNILSLGDILSDICFKNNIVPIFLEVLQKDESMVVQTNFLQKLDNVDLTESLDTVKIAIRRILTKSQTNWRCRRSILMTFVDLAKFCSAEYFSVHFKLYYVSLLGDSVFAVRRSAASVLPLLAKRYGIKWTLKNLLPYYFTFTRDTRYLYRYVPLFGICELLKPTLSKQSNTYLNDFKEILDNRQAVVTLVKIVKLRNRIAEELRQNVYRDMLSLKEEVEYTDNDSLSIYFETSLNGIKDKYKDVDVYSLDKRDFQDDQLTYLEGVLCLILTHFLEIVKTLNRDVTENVQIRTIYTLGQIVDFIERLTGEISEPWLQQCLMEVSEEESKRIDSEIDSELAKNTEEEAIDSNLTDTSAVLRLIDEDVTEISKSLIIESSSKETEKYLDEVSLAEDVIDILDKKLSER